MLNNLVDQIKNPTLPIEAVFKSLEQFMATAPIEGQYQLIVLMRQRLDSIVDIPRMAEIGRLGAKSEIWKEATKQLFNYVSKHNLTLPDAPVDPEDVPPPQE